MTAGKVSSGTKVRLVARNGPIAMADMDSLPLADADMAVFDCQVVGPVRVVDLAGLWV